MADNTCWAAACTEPAHPVHDPCCSSHSQPLCCQHYRRFHFVETACGHEVKAPTPEPLTAEHREGEHLWRIEAHDDQPIADGKKYAADRRVVVLRDGNKVREFFYPSYRIWTLLAHWTEGLADLEEAQGA